MEKVIRIIKETLFELLNITEKETKKIRKEYAEYKKENNNK